MKSLTGSLRFIIPGLSGFLLCVLLTPVLIKIARRSGFVAQPREDRWNKKPTALLGGVGIFLSVLIPFLLFVRLDHLSLGLILGLTAVFLLGLADDLFPLAPQVKLIVQIAAAILVISFGISVKIVPFLAVPLTIFWIVGITNAFNILDNIDGLAAGIALIAALNIFVYSLLNRVPLVDVPAVILAGAALGFLVFNFNPAKIFMGDSGSLFLGFALSLITIMGTWKAATDLLVTLIVPLLIMVIPIFDVSLVSFTRMSRGRSIARGGTDHSSHRLVFLGFSEKKAVVFLMAASAVFGGISIALSRINPLLTVLILLLLAVVSVFFGIFLGQAKVDAASIKGIYKRSLILYRVLLHKKQILQIAVDLILIVVAYVSAYLLRFEGELAAVNLALIEQSLPVLILLKMGAFAVFRLYQGEWKYAGVHDLIKIVQAALLGSIGSILLLLFFFRFEGYSRVVFVSDFVLTVVLIGGSRGLIRIFREYFSSAQISHSKKSGTPVLIVGAGDCGELVIREIKNNPRLRYVPVGFIDDDPEKKGRMIHGIPVLGDRSRIPELVVKNGIRKIFIAILSADPLRFADVISACEDLRIDYEFVKPLIE